MGLRTFVCASLLVGVCSLPASAQQLATTVQLPTFSFFTVNTTVVVPDRGGMQTGRQQRAMRARQFFGPGLPGGAGGWGMQQQTAGANVNAQIHDLDADGPETGALKPTPRADAETLDARIERTRDDSASGSIASLAEIRRSQAADEAAQQRAAKRYVERAETAASEGKVGAARVYYRMALRRASGTLADEIAAKLVSLDARKDDAAVAHRPER